MSFLESFDIRYSEMEDLTFLTKWFEDPLSCNQYPFGFDEKEEALKNWIGFSKFKASLTGTLEGVPCAIATLFLMPYRKVAHHCGFFIIVDPEVRKKGIGTSMVRNILHLAKTRFKLESVHAEVYEHSPLLPLLEKLNFQLFATQENYVKIGECSKSRLLLEHYFEK